MSLGEFIRNKAELYVPEDILRKFSENRRVTSYERGLVVNFIYEITPLCQNLYSGLKRRHIQRVANRVVCNY